MFDRVVEVGHNLCWVAYVDATIDVSFAVGAKVIDWSVNRDSLDEDECVV